MKKSIIAIAVAGILAAPLAAQAEVKVFGKMHMSVGAIKEKKLGVTTTDNIQVRSHASRLGFKGAHDLGNGLTAKYHIEFQVNPGSNESDPAKADTAGGAIPLDSGGDKNGSAGLKRRNQWVGLGGGWGEARIGRQDTPLKLAQGKFDQFNDTDADIKGHYKISQGEQRLDHVLSYMGKFGGLKVAAAVIPGQGDGKKVADGGTGTGDGLADTVSVAAMYTAGPLYVSLAHNAYDSTPSYETDSLSRVVGTYKMGAMQLGLLYETGGYGGKAEDRDMVGASFAIGMGKNKIKLQYVDSKDSQTVEVKRNQTSVGYDMKLSKQVTGYAMYTKAEEKQGSDKNEYTFTGAGLIVKF